MAKIKPSALIDSITGKYNGSSFQYTRYGLQLNNKVNQKKRRSPAQSKIRQGFQNIARAWRKLTDVERESWRNNASSPALGYNLFQQRNFIRAYNGDSLLNSYVVGRALEGLDISFYQIQHLSNPTLVRMQIVFTFSNLDNSGNYSLLISIVQGTSAGAAPQPSNGTSLNWVEDVSFEDDFELLIWNLPYPGSNAYPPPWVEGRQIYANIRIYEKSSGFLSFQFNSPVRII